MSQRSASRGFRELASRFRDDHHEEAMRTESNCPAAPEDDGERASKAVERNAARRHLQWNLDLC